MHEYTYLCACMHVHVDCEHTCQCIFVSVFVSGSAHVCLCVCVFDLIIGGTQLSLVIFVLVVENMTITDMKLAKGINVSSDGCYTERCFTFHVNETHGKLT